MVSSPVENQLIPVNVIFFKNFSTEIFEFSFNPWCKIEWPPGRTRCQYDHRCLFSREMGNIRACKEVSLQKLISQIYVVKIAFVVQSEPFEELFGKGFSFPFSAKCFDRNFRCFLSCTLHFLNVMKFKDSRHIQRYIFHYFLYQ